MSLWRDFACMGLDWRGIIAGPHVLFLFPKNYLTSSSIQFLELYFQLLLMLLLSVSFFNNILHCHPPKGYACGWFIAVIESMTTPNGYLTRKISDLFWGENSFDNLIGSLISEINSRW